MTNGRMAERRNGGTEERMNGGTDVRRYGRDTAMPLPHFPTSILALILLILTACGNNPAVTATRASQPNTTTSASATATLAPTATHAYPAPVTATVAPTAESAYPAPTGDAEGDILVFTYEVVNTYPHDPDAFTQGLVYEAGGILYEGTGLRGESSLRKVELETGKVLQIHRLADQYFGEGIAVYDDRIAQLTWQSNVGFVYEKESFQQTGDFEYPTEGWGLTYDDERLIMSDGTATLHFLDPDTFKEIGTVEVNDANGPVTRLNELEYIDGEVYANVWTTDRIVRIDPETGQVTAWIDLTGLLSQEERAKLDQVDVLNGIAYDAENDRFFVTGKWWPTVFEIVLLPAEN